jgi:tetratricopeptide (TPR) repeat protein
VKFLNNRAFQVSLLLALATIALYWQSGGHEFINYDDNVYITDNPHVSSGLTMENVQWAFSTGYAANWHPLTWISHMIDCQLFGLHAGAHHLVGAMLHALNAVLLFLVLRRMTGFLWQSAFVAALFALHPLHVESVEWASERKDLVSTLFWILTMWAYALYVERRSVRHYLLAALFLALGLMAKPMLVTLPLVLLLLDYWPLRRFEVKGTEEKRKGRKGGAPRGRQAWSTFVRLALEKLPLLGLAVGSAAITYFVQQSVAMKFGQQFSFALRLENALLSYADYVKKMFWPGDLALLYVHRAMSADWQVVMLPFWEVGLALLALALVTFAAVRNAARSPYLLVGWLWYLVTLVPVIGLVQVGEQAMADRYTYVPLTGLFMIVAWGAPKLATRLRMVRPALIGLSLLVLAALTAVSWRQIGFWQNSVTIFENTVRNTEVNPVAHYNLGYALHMQGKLNEAISQYTEALRIVPFYTEAFNMLQLALQAQGDNRRLAEAKSSYGAELGKQGRFPEAAGLLSDAVRLNPGLVDAHNNLGIVLAMQGKMHEARVHFEEALRINPGQSNAHFNLGLVLAAEDSLGEAILQYNEALRLNPDYPEARTALEKARQAYSGPRRTPPPAPAK